MVGAHVYTVWTAHVYTVWTALWTWGTTMEMVLSIDVRARWRCVAVYVCE